MYVLLMLYTASEVFNGEKTKTSEVSWPLAGIQGGWLYTEALVVITKPLHELPTFRALQF